MMKLSELSDDVEVSVIESNVAYTVAALKREILELGEAHHLTGNWFTIERKRWAPSAQNMINTYIDYEYDEMYEDWDDRAKDCLTEQIVSELQAVLDRAFKGDHATIYWSYEDPVEIDIVPPDME